MTTFAKAQAVTRSDALVHPRYRPDVDGLRAVAVLSVVMFHAFPQWLPGGFTGVDVFFVISGFLISTIILTNMQLGTFSFAEFYARRIRRIFPALLLVMAAVLIAGWFVLLPSEYKLLGKHIASGAGFVSNFALWRESGYFDVDAETKPLLHLWSLGIEEQFYIFWPLALWAGWRWRMNLLAVTLVVFAASLALNLMFVKPHAVATFYAPMTRAWELLFGALLAHLALDGKLQRVVSSSRYVTPDVIAASGATLLIAGLFALSSSQSFPGWRALIPVAGAALLIAAGPSAWINRHVLSNRVAVAIGLISFPLYLWHWPLLAFPRIVRGSLGVTEACVAILAAVGLAAGTYLLVEKRVRYGHGRTAAALLFSMIIAGFAGYVAFASNGAPQRPAFARAEAVQRQLVGPTWRYTTNELCKKRYQGLEYRYFCALSKDADPTMILLGDSFANALYGGIVQRHEFGHQVVLSFGSCSLGSSLSKPGDCTTLTRIINTTPSLRYAFLTAFWPRFDGAGAHIDLITGEPTNSGATAVDYARGLDARISFLEARGIKVFVFGPKPELGYEPKQCFARPFSSGTLPCAMARSLADEQEASITAIIKGVLEKHPNAIYFDQNDLFCRGATCSTIKDGMPLLRDFRHYSEFGSDAIIAEFVRRLSEKAPDLLRAP